MYSSIEDGKKLKKPIWKICTLCINSADDRISISCLSDRVYSGEIFGNFVEESSQIKSRLMKKKIFFLKLFLLDRKSSLVTKVVLYVLRIACGNDRL